VLEDGGVREDGDVIFGEIDAGFEKSDQFDQLLFDGLEALGERSI